MLSRKSKLFLKKILSFFSVVRGYNIWVVALAQYLSAIFILAPEERALDILLDWKMFLIVLASSLTIASGYIINNFYDAKKVHFISIIKIFSNINCNNNELGIFFGALNNCLKKT